MSVKTAIHIFINSRILRKHFTHTPRFYLTRLLQCESRESEYCIMHIQKYLVIAIYNNTIFITQLGTCEQSTIRYKLYVYNELNI